MKILISGAGIGGLTLAAFLKNSAIEFDIIEKAPTLDKQGFSIGMWANGRNVLKKLGLADKLDAYGDPIHAYNITDGAGNILKKYNLDAFTSKYGMGYTHLDRSLLHSWLLELVGTNRILRGVNISNFEKISDAVSVTFSNGTKSTYDLVVGADGIHSEVRKLAFGDKYERYDDWRIWYTWNNNKNPLASVTESIEAGQYLGIFTLKEKTLAVMIAPSTHGLWDKTEGRVDRLKKMLKDESSLPSLLQSIKESDIVPSDLCHIKMKSIVQGRIVLIGDAAHGFEPYAGLGASMAMEDAYILAGELLKSPSDTRQALCNYEKKRRERVHIAQKLTNRMRLWSTVKTPFVRKTINFLVPMIPESFFTKAYDRLLREEI